MQKDREKVHKEVVKYIRRVNNQIGSDEYLGLNRFRLDIWSEKMYRYSDGSGVRLRFIFKISDSVTGNSAYFITSNYSYVIDIHRFANDFLIRCSDGLVGHIPQLDYIAYDVHEVVPYFGRKDRFDKDKTEDRVVTTYNYTNYNLF